MSKISRIIHDFIDRVNSDHLGAYSSQAAYFIILSALPFAIFALSIVQYTPLSYDDLLSVLQSMAPGMASEFIDGMLQQIYERSTIALTSFTVIFALWSAGRALFSITNGLNEIYHLRETRNYFHLRFNAMIYTMLLAMGMIVIAASLLFGKNLFSNLGIFVPFHSFFLFVMSIRLLVIYVLLIMALIFLYRMLPNRRTSLMEVLPGSITVSLGWMITSYYFAFIFSYTNSFSYMYGSLAGIMVLMLWLYFCAFQFFLGAELNHMISDGTNSGDSINDILDS